MDIYTATFHQPDGAWLATARHHDLRMSILEATIQGICDSDETSLLALPAGFLRAPSVTRRDVLASACLDFVRCSRVALAFGVDLAVDDEQAPLSLRTSSFAYLCDGALPLLWPGAQRVRVEDRPVGQESRCFSVGSLRVGLMISAEIFNADWRRQLERDRPDVVLILSHAGVTRRWNAALGAIGRIAPIFVVGQTLNEKTALWTQAPPGWTRKAVCQTPNMTLHRHRRVGDQEACPRVSVPQCF